MESVLEDLIRRWNLRRGDQIDTPSLVTTADRGLAALTSRLSAHGIHEFYNPLALAKPWYPPLTLLAALTAELAADRCAVWVGRCCWPTWEFLRHLTRPRIIPSLYLNPVSAAQWVASIAEAARCPAVGVIIAAAGDHLPPVVGRRLQLAVEAQRAVLLLARPAGPWDVHSWAATRWQVQPLVSNTGHPEWEITLAADKGFYRHGDAASGAPKRWIVSWHDEAFYDRSTWSVFSAMGDRADAPAVRAGAAAVVRPPSVAQVA